MAGLKLKSGADFCNFEAFRMRLHNAGEDPTSDFGVGQIYFNTSDTSVGSARHVRLYDGTKFRSLAYLDDVDSRIKTIEDMLSVDTAEGVVSTWNEIQEFLDSVQEGTDLMDLLNGKLNTSGGTINGNLLIGAPNNTSYRYLQFARSGYGSRINVADGDLYVSFGGIDANGGLTATKVFSLGNNGIRYASDGKTYHDILTSAGGTIESENYDAFKIKRTTDAGAYITFENKNGRLGSIGFEQSTNKPILYRGATTSQIDYILHSGNIGDYAFPIGGGRIKGNSIEFGKEDNFNGVWARLYINAGTTVEYGMSLRYYYDGEKYNALRFMTSGVYYDANGTLFSLLHSGNVGEYALKTDGSNEMTGALLLNHTNPRIAFMAGGKTYGSLGYFADGLKWYVNSENAYHAIAFTDSDITGNAATANVLKSTTGIQYTYNFNSDKIFLFGNGVEGYKAYIDGSLIALRYGSQNTTGFILNSSGNVTIGASDLAGSGAKLYVDGDISTSGNLLFNHTKGLGFATSDGKAISIFVDNYNNLHLGYQNVSSVRFNSGKVIIGTTSELNSEAKLQVNGGIYADTFINFSTNASYGIFRGNLVSARLSSEDVAVASPKFYIGATCLIGDTKVVDSEARMLVYGKTYIDGDLHVTGNIIADGEVSAGGAAEEGGNAGSGGAFYSDIIKKGATQTTIAHGLGTDDIVVSIYEKDGVSGRWSIILTDVEIVDANNIIVSFGSATSVEHKVVIMGAVA